jgi:cytochrome c-type biogenesis protein CcmH/NrfG
VAGILLLGILAYSSSLHGEFVFDDIEQLSSNRAIRDLASFLGPSGYRMHPNRYVAYLSFALNHHLCGYAPFGWHVVNLAIHLANALLVWALVVLAFRSPRLRASAIAPSVGAVAFASGALFVAHPLATQAVSYVVQRITSLATLFYLLTVVLYLAWRLRPAGRGRVALQAGFLVSSVLAFRTKEISFTLPVALALVEWAFLDGTRRRWLPILPVAALSLLVPLSLLDMGMPAAEVLASADTVTRVQASVSRTDYLRTQAVVVVRYLGMLVVPVGQVLDHDVPIRRSWLAPEVAGSALLIAALCALAGWLSWRSRPGGARPPLDPSVRLVALGIAWFFVTLSVESSVIPIADVMNEHRAYLPSAGLLPAAATAVALLFLRAAPGHVARDTAVAGALAAAILGVATWNRNLVWRDEIALWSDVAQKSPRHWRALKNLATALFKQGRVPEAISALRRHLEVFPDEPVSHMQLGVGLYVARRPVEAEAELRRAVDLGPEEPDMLFSLAFFLIEMERRPEARPYLERLVRVEKDRERRLWAEAELAR